MFEFLVLRYRMGKITALQLERLVLLVRITEKQKDIIVLEEQSG